MLEFGLYERKRDMSKNLLATAQILTLLAEHPARIVSETKGVRPALLNATPPDGGWSANDVLAHLRSCADVWGDCMRVMLRRMKEMGG